MVVDGFSAPAIALGLAALQRGELLGLPTETVYGLAADASDPAAVARIFAAKGRPAAHPLIVHVADAPGAVHFAASLPGFARRLVDALWPGPLTLILPRRPGVATQAAGGHDSIGLRCPSHPVAQDLLRACAESGLFGLAAPSANKFGRVSPTTARHVEEEFGAGLLVLDGGPCDLGIESSIVDCTRGVPVLLRPGTLTLAAIEQACGVRVLHKDQLSAPTASAPAASGTLESHYAPSAKVRLMHWRALKSALDLLGRGLDAGDARIAVYARQPLRPVSDRVLYRRMPDDALATAQQLFAVLREFDAQGVRLIWIESPPDEPAWAGVRDRLERASAG